MSTFFQIVGASLAVSAMSLVGVVMLLSQKKILSNGLVHLVALSAGTLMAGAFLHLLPESIELLGSELPLLFALGSFIVFFVIEKLLHWRHCHTDECEVHSFGYLNLLGDGVHNFIDGLMIAAGFLAGPEIGVATTLAIMLHEIPQEFSDFAVLLHAGFSKSKALAANFGSALAALAGAVSGFWLVSNIENFVAFLLPFAAGGFLYIAASDLMPEILKEKQMSKSLVSFGFFLAGVVMMYGLKFLEVG